MSDDLAAARRFIAGQRLRTEELLAPQSLGMGTAYDSEQSLSVAALGGAKVLVVQRGTVAQIPGAILAGFCLESEVAFSNGSIVALRKRKNAAAAFSSWFGRDIEQRLEGGHSSAVKPSRAFNGTFVDQKTILSTTWWGDFIYLPSVDAGITPHILRQGRWEPWVEECFRSMLRPGMSVVDIGCNVGYYGLSACNVVGHQGHVTAIDANPEMTRMVQMSMLCNGYGGMSKVITAAIMKDPGEVTLSIPRTIPGGASILASGADDLEKIKVSGGPLQNYVSHIKRIDVLKIDAEGAEPMIFEGAKEMLARDRDILVFMEFVPIMIQATINPRSFLDKIRAEGFHFFDIKPGEGPVAIEDAELAGRSWSELLLTRNPARIGR